jgi:anti-anti-sigma factor
MITRVTPDGVVATVQPADAQPRVEPVVVVEELSKRLTLVRIVGELDMRAVEHDTQLAKLRLSPPKYLRVDATRATFIDSNGLAALAAVAVSVRKNEGTVSTKASTAVRRVIELCGVGDHLGMRPTKAPRPVRARVAAVPQSS